MKNLFFATFLIAVSVLTASAQSGATVIARYGVAPNGAGYKLVEVFDNGSKNGWIRWDAGYVDFRNAKQYRELFIGAGKVVHAGEKTLVVAELYYDQASDGAAYLQPWVLVAYKFTSSIRAEAVYFPYLPINDKATRQHVIERVKVERDSKSFKIGVGYSGYQFGKTDWQSKPFLTFTKKFCSFGDVELWLQKTKTGAGVQLRYTKSFK